MYPTNVDHQQNIFKIGNPSGEPEINKKKKKKKKKIAISKERVTHTINYIIIRGMYLVGAINLTKEK